MFLTETIPLKSHVKTQSQVYVALSNKETSLHHRNKKFVVKYKHRESERSRKYYCIFNAPQVNPKIQQRQKRGGFAKEDQGGGV